MSAARPTFRGVLFLLVLVLPVVAACAETPPATDVPAAAPAAAADTVYYGIEIEGVLCGYNAVRSTDTTVDGRPVRTYRQDLEVHYTALGSRVDTTMAMTFEVDPETGQYRYFDADIHQGQVELGWTVRIEDGKAHITSTLSGTAQDKTVDLPPDIVLSGPEWSPHLVRDFVESDRAEATYAILDPRDAVVQTSKVTRVGDESLELAGRTWNTVVLDDLNQDNGVRTRQWLDRATGRTVQVVVLDKRRIFLADATVVNRVKVADLDPSLLVPAGMLIADVPGITSMKIRAKLAPTGSWVRPEDLNVPGQSFEGTVEANRIEGVFTIRHERYDGAAAPPFPPRFGDDVALAPYLAPSELIQSDDPVLIEQARAITAGAADAWDAGTRIARWVAENIGYAIPGGGTARKTYDLRAGECGAHSNLTAALARAVGIPARVVWGCMYVPNGGGSFGQHGWNELYMGEQAGWIPIDSTAFETDFVDSGHVRIGVHESLSTALNPIEMEVLEYTHVSAAAAVSAGPSAEERFAEYLGTYALPQLPDPLTVKIQDGALVIDIPNKIALAMKEPDERERWYCKLTDQLYAEFDRDEAGKVAAMVLHEMVRMQRSGPPDAVAEDVPEALRPLIGPYVFAQVGATFQVVHHDGRLAIDDPMAKTIVHLGEPDEEGWRLDEYGKNRVKFDRNPSGEVVALVIDAASRFQRQ